MGAVVFVTGGARSGKSEFAEAATLRAGSPVAYIATARPYGADMTARIEKHRERRGEVWATIEEETDLRGALGRVPGTARAVLVECLYTWATNRLLGLGDPRTDGWTARVQALPGELAAELRGAIGDARRAPWELVLVTSEIGLGLTPELPRQRAFRDLVGTVNRVAAELADEAHLVVAGLPMTLKARAC